MPFGTLGFAGYHLIADYDGTRGIVAPFMSRERLRVTLDDFGYEVRFARVPWIVTGFPPALWSYVSRRGFELERI